MLRKHLDLSAAFMLEEIWWSIHLQIADVATVLCDQWNQKVIVTGNVDPSRLLKNVKRIKGTSEIWSRSIPPQSKKETKAASKRSAINHGGEYALSYDQFLPAYNESFVYDPYPHTSYKRMHNNSVITNPDYLKHVQYYWSWTSRPLNAWKHLDSSTRYCMLTY